jgi:hypothetical protein
MLEIIAASISFQFLLAGGLEAGMSAGLGRILATLSGAKTTRLARPLLAIPLREGMAGEA